MAHISFNNILFYWSSCILLVKLVKLQFYWSSYNTTCQSTSHILTIFYKSYLFHHFAFAFLTHTLRASFRLFQTQRISKWQFWIWWKWHQVIQKGRKHCGKRRNCSSWAIYSFPTVFSKELYCRHVKTRACFGKWKAIPKLIINNFLKVIFPQPCT